MVSSWGEGGIHYTISFLLSFILVSYLLSLVSCLLSLVSCLLSLVSCLLSLVSCLLSSVSCLLSSVSFPLSPQHWHWLGWTSDIDRAGLSSHIIRLDILPGDYLSGTFPNLNREFLLLPKCGKITLIVINSLTSKGSKIEINVRLSKFRI